MPPLALLAGGLATRLRPTTTKIPKAMLEVAGEPFIAHVLRLLRREGVLNIVICSGYLGDQIESYVGNGAEFGCQVRYSTDGEQLLGTGGALRKALPLLDEHFFVMYGDTYLDITFRPVYESFLQARMPALMTVLRNSNRWDKSNVEFADNVIKDYNKVRRTHNMQHIDYGLGVVDARAFRSLPENVPFDLAGFYGDLAARGQLAGYEVNKRFYELGSPAGLAEAAAYFSNKLQFG